MLSSSPSSRASAFRSAGEMCSVVCEDGSFTSRTSSYKLGRGGGEGRGGEGRGGGRGGEGRGGGVGREEGKRGEMVE